MFGPRYFGARYFGPRYFGSGSDPVLVVPENGAWYMRNMLPLLLEEDAIAGMELFVAAPGLLCASTEFTTKYQSRSAITAKYASSTELTPKYESRSEIESCN